MLALALMIGGVAGGGWLWSRPVPLTLEVNPGDALIVLNASIPATESGSFVRDAVEPGVHRFTVSRTGFETRTLDIDARRFRGANRRVDLTALPVHFSLSASPANASIRVSRQGSELAAEQGSLSTTIPAGEVTLLITAPGRNDYERTLFLDTATSLEVRLDPEGQLVHGLSLIACAGAPKAVALTPDGTEAWATILNGPPSIEIFDPRSGARSGEVDLGTHGAVEIVFSADGTRAYASQMETARVFEIDVRSRRTLRAFDTQSAWTKVVALAADGTTLYAANWSGDDVSEIDLASGRLLRRIPVADTPRGLWPSADGTTLWVASFGTGDLERVDLNSGKVSRVFKNPGGALRHLVADETRGVLFASDMAKDCVWATDMRSGMTRRFATVGHKPNTIDLSPDGRILFVSNRGANNPVSYYLPGPEWGSVLLLDARTGRTLDGIVGGNQCTALDVSGDGRTLVFSDFLDDRLRVYEVPPHGQLAAGEGGRSKTLARDVRK